MNTWYLSHIVLLEGTLLTFLLALSIQVPLRFGVFSFAGVAAYGVGSYGTAIVFLRYSWPPYASLLAGLAVAVAGAAVLALVVRRLSGMYLAMATIAVILIVQVVVQNGGTLTGGALGLFGVITTVSFAQLAVLSGVVAVVLTYTEFGALGRRISTVRQDPELATSMGINVAKYQFVSFLVSGVLGATAGGMEVLLRTTVSPRSLGFQLLITALTVVILGGFSSWLGAAIGAVFVTWLPVLLQQVETYQHLVYGCLVVLAAIFFPSGILGIVGRVIYAVRSRLSKDADGDADADGTGGEAAAAALGGTEGARPA